MQSVTIGDYFKEIEDPRIERSKLHSLENILVIAICAIICGAETFTDMAMFGRTKRQWLSRFLDLSHGTPSHDTFGRLFSLLDPDKFSHCFGQWIHDLAKLSQGEIIAIDGKTLRRSFNRTTNKSAIHMVSAWAEANALVLGQVKVDEKSNEIEAIPRLLELLDIHRCIVTLDAMGCQTSIAKQIKDQGGEYVIGLKGNQGTLHEDVKQWFLMSHEKKDVETAQSVEKDHGRLETRQVHVSSNVAWLKARHLQWPSLASIVCVESVRDHGEGQVEKERRYYISSLIASAEKLGQIIRSHWGVENSLHWILDVAFDEDHCRVRKDHAPENFAMMRHMALNMLKQEASVKAGIKGKRLKCGWDEAYLMKVLHG